MQGEHALIATERGSLPRLQMQGSLPGSWMYRGQHAYTAAVWGGGQPAHLVVEGQLAHIARKGRSSRVHSRSTQPLAGSSPFLYLPVLALGSMPQSRKCSVSSTTYHVNYSSP